MSMRDCCERCKTGRRTVTKYKIVAIVDEPTLSDGESNKLAGEWKGSLCPQHYEYLNGLIQRAFSPPKKRANS